MRNATVQDFKPGREFWYKELGKVYIESGPDSLGNCYVISRDTGVNEFVNIDKLFLLQLDTLEGRPIYPGDELYHKAGKYITIVGKHNSMLRSLGGSLIFKESLAWNPPSTGWVNVYFVDERISLGPVYPTKEEALEKAYEGAIDCIQITWTTSSI